MKTTFKTLFAAALFTGIGSTAFAQLGETETINVNARVLKQIVLAGEDVRFGAVTAGNIAILDPIDPADNEFVSIQALPGRVTVDATGGEIIQVIYPAAIELEHTTIPGEFISYVPRISVRWDFIAVNDLAGRATSVLLDDDDAFVATTNATGAAGTGIGGTGYFSTDPTVGPTRDRATLFIGGNLYETGTTTDPIPALQETGTYTNTMLFNINYFGI